MTNLADRCSHDTFQHWPYTNNYRLGCFAQKGDEGKLQRERERGRGRECIIGGCCGQLIQARAMIMIVSGECDIRVPMLETGEPQSVPQLAPCDPGHLTHPTDICQPDQQPQSGHNLSDWLLDLPRRTSLCQTATTSTTSTTSFHFLSCTISPVRLH